MSAEIAARLDQVTKEFRLGQERSNLRSLIPGRRGETAHSAMFRAVDDVSFVVCAGESVGLIGQNGAGKSTILKLLSGILEPTSGVVETRGRRASIIELGVGFDPELTGRENIGFAADMIGLSRREVTSRLDWIVDFSGIEEFLDMPVKRYSTGMAARLGFSIATAVTPGLLIVDEVLSVGDYSFQQKSFERIRELHREGAALILVSHSLWMMNALCDRLLLLEHGSVVVDGSPSEVVGTYLGPDAVAEEDPEVGAQFLEYRVPAELRGAVRIDSIEALPQIIKPNESVTIRATVTVTRPTAGMLVMSIFTAERAVFAEREAGPSHFLGQPGQWVVEARIPAVPLGTGRFQARFAVLPEDDRHHEQTFPAALSVRTTGFEIDGGISARPGLKLAMDWTTDQKRGGPGAPPIEREEPESR